MTPVLRNLFSALALTLICLPQSARACAACFGRSDSKLAEGMNMGILSLLLVVMFVLGGIAAFFIYLARKSATTAAAVAGSSASGPQNNQMTS